MHSNSSSTTAAARSIDASAVKKKSGYLYRLKKDLVRNKLIYLILLPVVAYYVIFHYVPMYGAQIAFKQFSPAKGILASEWVGFIHFKQFFSSFYFWRVLKNTLLISFYELIFGFPAPILLALLLNEVRVRFFKRAVQTITYIPHFISVVIVVGMTVDFFSLNGLVNQLLGMFGVEPLKFFNSSDYFRFLFVGSGIWQGVGWGSIIYLAAIAGIDPSLYEAARVDGANRFKQIRHITLPGIAPTIIILFILTIGHFMSVGAEKIILLYNPAMYETADTISTFVYRKGLLESNYSFSAAVGLFNSVINFILLIITNRLSSSLTDTKLW
ncbi:ABC transporter permease [Paenibacillus qinlingensis]|uniref:ABC transporter permease n=1 Tax=Paenibacillus qinlingensis TaxID=1837343 RepID=UPI0015633A96|nr:ABC transporter permease subunit [Paenibacillus qinlingensis]NQX62684.1 sugar ABC transporter permease [Paenibacillus qinlingensis]